MLNKFYFFFLISIDYIYQMCESPRLQWAWEFSYKSLYQSSFYRNLNSNFLPKETWHICWFPYWYQMSKKKKDLRWKMENKREFFTFKHHNVSCFQIKVHQCVCSRVTSKWVHSSTQFGDKTGRFLCLFMRKFRTIPANVLVIAVLVIRILKVTVRMKETYADINESIWIWLMW